MASGVELCNMALLKLGAKMIANFTDTHIGQICNLLLQPSLDDFGAQGVWSWNEKKATLVPIPLEEPEGSGEFIKTPGTYKLYLYNLPNDFITMRKVFSGGYELTEYYMSGIGQLEEDADSIDIAYTARISATADGEVGLPVYCYDAFTSYFAHRLSPAVDDGNRSGAMMQEYMMKAQAVYQTDLQMRPTKISRTNYHKGV